ncbi:hypothetical protein [Sphingobacterium multivorum]|uniref:hypothetical protein n=1 Tax=Sphingobacterium multivorum TaxID=28454 RepID=UPI003DA2BE85
MNNDKYIAILNNYAGDSDNAFCTVLAKQLSKSIDGYIIEDGDLLKEFHGVKEIFVPRLKQHNFKEGDVLGITKKEIINEVDRNPKLHYTGVERAFSPICLELSDIEVDDVFLNVELLQKEIFAKHILPESNFYVSDGMLVYGPFKIDRSKVIPASSLVVNGYDVNSCLKIDHPILNETSLILHLSKEIVKKYDCSTNIQLIERVKDIISKSRMTDETRRYINTIKDLIASENLDELQLAKINKVQGLLDKVSFRYEEFNTLRSNSSFWSGVFDNSVKDFEDRLKNDFLEKSKTALDQKMQKEFEKLNLIQEQLIKCEIRLEELSVITENKIEIVTTLTNQISLLEQQKDEIILSLQIQGRIGSGAAKESKSNYEIQKSLNESRDFYVRTHDFLDDLADFIELDDRLSGELAKLIKQLRTGNFFKCNSIEGLLTAINILGNSQIYLNNAEVDWIKFEKFVNQGLLEAFTFAHDNPSQSVYYLLQDFNIASPECYAKPLIDLSRKIRKTLPTDGRAWPSNLRIVFFPLELDIDDFGFEVNDETFLNWEELVVSSVDCNGINLPMAFNLEERKS